MTELQYKDPVRNINQEFLHNLDVISNKEYPLPGARCRGGEKDPRFTHLEAGEGEMVMFNHLATIRHKPSSVIYVVFRQTMDALFLEQQDPIKYPSWLMNSNQKKTELSTYIHFIKPPYDKNPRSVVEDRRIMDVSGQTRVDRWLQEITVPWVFDTVAYFLLKNNIISQELYGSIK